MLPFEGYFVGAAIGMFMYGSASLMFYSRMRKRQEAERDERAAERAKNWKIYEERKAEVRQEQAERDKIWRKI
ncbi:unnamed protein product [Rhodiola kirilowii]